MKIALTASQLSLWTGQKINPESPLYNTAYAFDISGDLNVALFQKGFQSVVDTTDAMRLVFFEEDGRPFQEIRPACGGELEFIDFSNGPDPLNIDDWLLSRTQRMLNISEKVFDAALLKVGKNQYTWFLNMHHLVTDAVSFKVIFQKMADFYQSLLTGGTVKLAMDGPSYADFVEFKLKEERNGPAKASDTDNSNIPKKKPVFYGRTAEKNNTAYTRMAVPLGSDRTKKIRDLAKNPEIRSLTEHLTRFNIIAGLLFIYLFRVSGQNKLVIGAPTPNRVSKKFSKIVGYCIEVFPLFNQIVEKDSLLSVLERGKLEMNAYLRFAQEGRNTPEISRNINVLLNYLPAGFTDFNGLGTVAKWVHPHHMDSNHQLRCQVLDYKEDEEITIYFDLNHSTFDEELRLRVPDHFLNLLDALLDDIHQPIERPSLLSDGELRQLTAPPSLPKWSLNDIVGQFEALAGSTPNAVSLQCGSETLTYSGLNKRANQLAHYLRQNGIDREKRVALLFSKSTAYIVGVLAVMKAGGTFIPITSDNPAERIRFIVSDSECTLLLTEERLLDKTKLLSVPIIAVEGQREIISEQSSENLGGFQDLDGMAYILYTSGSTGNPKGVLISQRALSNYLSWAGQYYGLTPDSVFPLFTSIGFDLTISATFLPLLNGGRLLIYPEPAKGPDLTLLQVIEENMATIIKLTPSHLALLNGMDLTGSRLSTMIVGGEDFKTPLAKSIQMALGDQLSIFNEYGPTEATVGCIAVKFDYKAHTGASVPIGTPIDNMTAYILDRFRNPVPKGVVGELYVGGAGLAQGYIGRQGPGDQKFVEDPFISGARMYRTGDLGKINAQDQFEFLGRMDEQVKLRGYRIELADIESNLTDHPSVRDCAVVLLEDQPPIPEREVVHCIECGLPSNYPDTDFDAHGICNLCSAFKDHKNQVDRYFKTEDALKELLLSKRELSPHYDCLSLLSGGKDSMYILAQLIDMGLRVLAFTLDNGYISEQAKGNIDRIVKKLGVDHIYGGTAHMNEIFVDSLKRHQNVCNGCFKTIYTLSAQIALEKEIPFIVTGLSRGQFFETPLTEELFSDENVDIAKIDTTILEARKLYHQEEDAVKSMLDVSTFQEVDTFDKVQFVNFYRYSDVSLEKKLAFLKEKVGWAPPAGTGRSTNCLINQVGIHVHKKQKGYSNYSFPNSWDVRLGHKTRNESLEEINEVIDEPEVLRIMAEIGYDEVDPTFDADAKLVGYYTGNQTLSDKTLRRFMAERLPAYMVPSRFKHLEEMPLTKNGKVDKTALKGLNEVQLSMEVPFTAPRNEIEELLAEIWGDVLKLKKLGVHDDFITLGGHSLAAIRVTSRINEQLDLGLPLNKIFELPTIAGYAKYIEDTLIKLMEE